MSSKIFKKVLNVLWFLAIIFPIFNLGAWFIGIPKFLFNILFPGTVLYLFFVLRNLSNSNKIKDVFKLALPFIFINCLISISPNSTLAYWPIYILLVSSIDKIITNISAKQFEDLKNMIPHFFAITSVITYIILFPYINSGLSTKQSLGMISGAWLITSVYAKKFKLIYIVLSCFILLESDSRGSIAFAFIVIFIYLLTQIKSKNAVWIISLIIISISFIGKVEQIALNKLMQKEYQADNTSEAIDGAILERQILIDQGYELFKQKPVFGYGMKSHYEKLMEGLGEAQDLGVHNGYLEILIQLGIVSSIPFALLIIFLLLRVLKTFLFQRNFFGITHLFIIYGLIRGYGESYLFFNVGNMFSIFFLFFTILLYTRESILLPVVPEKL
jgi:O-antigen ligase